MFGVQIIRNILPPLFSAKFLENKNIYIYIKASATPKDSFFPAPFRIFLEETKTPKNVKIISKNTKLIVALT